MENKDQGPPGSPGKLGQPGQPVSIFSLLKENMYFRKGNPSHICGDLELHNLAHCHQLHFYERGFNPAAQGDPACTAQMSGQLLCQHTNALRAAIPPPPWAVLQHLPSCQV